MPVAGPSAIGESAGQAIASLPSDRDKCSKRRFVDAVEPEEGVCAVVVEGAEQDGGQVEGGRREDDVLGDVTRLEESKAVAAQAVLEPCTPEDRSDKQKHSAGGRDRGVRGQCRDFLLGQARLHDLEARGKRIEVVEPRFESVDPQDCRVELQRVQRAAGRNRPNGGRRMVVRRLERARDSIARVEESRKHVGGDGLAAEVAPRPSTGDRVPKCRSESKPASR